MPSSMIHLLTAYKYNPNASVAFWIGNIAPDAVSGDWKEIKNVHHERIAKLFYPYFRCVSRDIFVYGVEPTTEIVTLNENEYVLFILSDNVFSKIERKDNRYTYILD